MITIHRIADGKIAEDWVLVGSLMFFQQLGLVAETEKIFRDGGITRHPEQSEA